jgi:hypothetical protein
MAYVSSHRCPGATRCDPPFPRGHSPTASTGSDDGSTATTASRRSIRTRARRSWSATRARRHNGIPASISANASSTNDTLLSGGDATKASSRRPRRRHHRVGHRSRDARTDPDSTGRHTSTSEPERAPPSTEPPRRKKIHGVGQLVDLDGRRSQRDQHQVGDGDDLSNGAGTVGRRVDNHGVALPAIPASTAASSSARHKTVSNSGIDSSQRLADPLGSVSTSPTPGPLRRRPAANPMAVVVLPAPPFLFRKAIVNIDGQGRPFTVPNRGVGNR